MRRTAILAGLLLAGALLLPLTAGAKAARPHRVVFDVAINDPASFKVLFKNIDSLKAALAPEPVEVEVVAYAKGLQLYQSQDPEVVQGIDRLASQGVRFAACGLTAKALNLGQEQLGWTCSLVDGGLAEIVRLQEKGWSYVKLGAYSGLP